MVCVAAAPAVQGLAGGTCDRIDLAVFAEDLKVPVNRGQADVLASSPQLSMDLLGAAKARQAVKRSRHRLGLPRAADPGTADRGGYG